jgi:hypothetical protein
LRPLAEKVLPVSHPTPNGLTELPQLIQSLRAPANSLIRAPPKDQKDRAELPKALTQFLNGNSQTHSAASPELPDPPQQMPAALARGTGAPPMLLPDN